MQTDLPINEVLSALRAALEGHDAVVLEAPPGAGKTTIVPLALRQEKWLGQNKIIMLAPRRMAARAAAERMASLLGEKVGQTVGYRVRLEQRVSAATTIEVITEGILTRRLQNDPGLDDVGLLIFDEFHERSLDSDLGLALALQGRELFRQAVRPLKILVMSATLDGVAVSDLLGAAPVISSQGKMFPVEVHYVKRAERKQDIAAPVVATLSALIKRPETGNVLVFLPGQGEIRQVQQALPEIEGLSVAALHGGMSLEQQRAVINPADSGPLAGGSGPRKIVLATNIAETSLTIEGITTVLDSGLAREAVYDPGTGMTRLQTRRISQANATQRAGRAGRLRPGYCYRLWSEDQQRQLSPRSTPEILRADLTPLALQLLAWGVDDPVELKWLDAPGAGPWAQALELLRDFGALDGVQLTADGEQMARLPVHPRLAHMLLLGARWGMQTLACELAALLSERTSQQSADIELALTRLDSRVKRQAKHYARLCASLEQAPVDLQQRGRSEGAVGLLLAAAYPDRIGRRRQARGNVYQLSNGRSAALEPSDPLCNQEWLVAAELGGRVGRAEDRIYTAAALSSRVFAEELADRVQSVETVEWDEKADRLLAETQQRLGAIVLVREKCTRVCAQTRTNAVTAFLREKGLDPLPWTEELRRWQARVMLLHQHLGEPWPDVSDPVLLADLGWLEPWLGDVNKLRELELKSILQALLPWPLPRELEELAPERIEVPSGSSIRIDYSATPPVLAVKLQEMFGCESTPLIARGRVALLVHLLSPAARPLQLTQDLASFWRNGYEQVKKEMRGRYPRHPWPDDPLTAVATAKTRRRLQND